MHLHQVIALASAAITLPIALAGPACPPAAGQSSTNGSMVFSRDSSSAFEECDKSINCEVYFDDEWGMPLIRYKKGMGPGSEWYETNVQPYDPYFNEVDDQNMTMFDRDSAISHFDPLAYETNFMNETAFTKRDDAEDDDNDEDEADGHKKKKHKNKKHKKKDHYSFTLRRTHTNINYGNNNPGKFLAHAYKKCNAEGCGIGGSTYKKSGVSFIAPVSGGQGITQGTLVMKMTGDFPTRKGSSGLKKRFINALQYTAGKSADFKKKQDWQVCMPGACGGGGGCSSGHLNDQYKGGVAFAISRTLITPGGVATSGHLTIFVAMHVNGDAICSKVLSELGLVVGVTPGPGPYEGAVFGTLAQFLCAS